MAANEGELRKHKRAQTQWSSAIDEVIMDVKTAIQNGDADALRRLLRQDHTCANELIRWGGKNACVTHPLHYISDMLFEGKLPKGAEVSLVDTLIEAGADLNF